MVDVLEVVLDEVLGVVLAVLLTISDVRQLSARSTACLWCPTLGDPPDVCLTGVVGQPAQHTHTLSTLSRAHP